MDNVTSWKEGADDKLLLRDRSLWMTLLLGKWVLTRNCSSEIGRGGVNDYFWRLLGTNGD